MDVSVVRLDNDEQVVFICDCKVIFEDGSWIINKKDGDDFLRHIFPESHYRISIWKKLEEILDDLDEIIENNPHHSRTSSFAYCATTMQMSKREAIEFLKEHGYYNEKEIFVGRKNQ